MQRIPQEHGADGDDKKGPEVAETEVNDGPVVQLEESAQHHHEHAPMAFTGLARRQLCGAKAEEENGPEGELVSRREYPELVEQQKHTNSDDHQAGGYRSADAVSFAAHESSPYSCASRLTQLGG